MPLWAHVEKLGELVRAQSLCNILKEELISSLPGYLALQKLTPISEALTRYC